MSALAVDVDVGQLALLDAGNKLRGLSGGGTDVISRLTDGTLSRTMSGASTLTLTLEDDRRDLLRSGLFDQSLDVQVDDQWWRLVQVSKSGDQLTLTFEDRVVALLRTYTAPRKAARSSMTRAEFALSLVREVKPPIPFYCPDVHVVQPIEKASQKPTAAQKAASSGQGVAAGAKLTVKGAAATKSQIDLAERAMDVASSLGASDRATLALLEACTVESLFSNPSGPSADGYGSRGILQVRDVTAAGMRPPISNLDVEACVNAFLNKGFTGAGGAIVLAAKNPSWTTGKVAQTVQGSAYPGRYDQWAQEARAWLASYSGSGIASQPTGTEPFQFQRGGTDGTKQDSWTCLQSLASDVHWTCFAANGQIVFAAETTLLKAKVAATLSEQTLGVDAIDFDIDNGKTSNDATVTARANRWAFPPGSVIELEGSGPADGRWLVDTIDRGLFDATASIRLKRATVPLAEPAADQATATAGAAGGSSVVTAATVSGSPESIIDTICIPLAIKHGMATGISAGGIATANAHHGPTTTGNRSDHQGPPLIAWASDMSNGSSPTPQMDALAKELAQTFGIPWTGSGLVTKESGVYRYQLIYRTYEGGDHFNHVHFGVRRTDL